MKLTLPAAKDWTDNRGWIDGAHRGQDFGWGAGDQVLAAAPGTVVEVHTAGYKGKGSNGGWGNRVVIAHGGDNYTTYNHLAPGTIRVGLGDSVSRGQHIGTMGETGDAPNGRHLHFELERGGRSPGRRVDPAPYYLVDLPGTGTTPFTPNTEEERTMKYAMRYTKSGVDYVIVGDTVSGWAFEYSTRDTKFNNKMMERFKFEEIIGVDESIYNAFKRSLAEVRPSK